MLLEGKINKPKLVMRSIHLLDNKRRDCIFLDFYTASNSTLLIVLSDYKYALLLYVRNNDNTHA